MSNNELWLRLIKSCGGAYVYDELMELGIDPNNIGLVRYYEGTVGHWPKFQFHETETGRIELIPLVEQVNKILLARDCPLETLGWWLSDRNAWVNGKLPYKVLGEAIENNLPEAANAKRRYLDYVAGLQRSIVGNEDLLR